MTPVRWTRNAVARIRADGLEGVSETAYLARLKFLRTVSPYVVDPSYVYEFDWDLLVVLDACRADLLRSVADEWAFLDEGRTVTSAGSMTAEWMAGNFTDEYREEMARTTYVSGNPFSESELDAEQFATLAEVWRHHWDPDAGTQPPRPVTDTAIDVYRRRDPGRMVVHYMQPHYPFVGGTDLGPGIDLDRFASDPFDDVWDRLRKGELDREAVWEAYRRNLQWVLEEVRVLLRNVDAANVVITSDHGNATGEWGVYGHPRSMPVDSLREVPWITATARDEGTHTPSLSARTTAEDAGTDDGDDGTVEDRLSDLGYVT